MVVTPATVGGLSENFSHLVKLGFKNIFIMTACGIRWPQKDILSLRKNLALLEKTCLKSIKNHGVQLLNLKEWFSPFRMNTELSVDFDGNIYSACISYLIHDRKRKKGFILGHIDRVNENIDLFEKKRLTNDSAMQVIFKENNILNNLESNIKAGLEMARFVNSLNNKLCHSDSAV
jgi:hypothetical protein